MDRSLHLVPRENVHMVWTHVIPLLQPAIERGHGTATDRDLYEALVAGEAQLWACAFDEKVELSLTTKIVQYKRNRSLLIQYIGGGNLKEYLSFLPDIEEWGKKNDCNFIELFGRKGWARILKDWDDSVILLRKDL